MEANKAILELRRNGGGPVHINLITTYSKDFSVRELPPVRAMRRFQAWDGLPEMPKGKIAVYVGSHNRFSGKQAQAIDRFCATHDAIAIYDHTSGYYGKYKLLPTLVQLQTNAASPFPTLDLMIHIGEVSAATFAGTIPAKEIWRVSEDGELRDPFKKLTTVFQMSEESFFLHYGRDGEKHREFIDCCKGLFDSIYSAIPELPFSNIWTAMQHSSRLPKGSLFHMGVSNTLRSWNMFHLPEGVESVCNVGCCGIDGCVSSLIGASLVNPNRLCFGVVGDLTFFYNLNSLGNRHIGKNLRLMLINNGIGAEFRIYSHLCYAFGENADKYMAVGGHFGNKSHTLVKHYAEDLGFRYLSANNKEEFMEALKEFASPELPDKSMILEVFTRHEDESEALSRMSNIEVDAVVKAKVSLKNAMRNMLNDEAKAMIKKVIK